MKVDDVPAKMLPLYLILILIRPVNPGHVQEAAMPNAKLLSVLALSIGLLGMTAVASNADTFDFTSCHLSGGCGTATQFGTVTLTQSGTSVNFDVVLNSGNRFVETGAGGGGLFLFNDTISGSTVTSITATLDGADVTGTVVGGFTGLTNQSPLINADGTGDWSAIVECTVTSDCNGGSAPNMNDLHFTVTNATVAQLEVGNALGNMFVADILCGQTGCTGLTGPVDVSVSNVPLPGALPLFASGLVGLGLLGWRRKRKAKAA